MAKCPVCDRDLVLPRGSREAPILIVTDAPSEKELWDLTPFTGPIGGVIQAEFRRVGIPLDKVRATNFWLHAENKNEECRNKMIAWFIREANGKAATFLMGADVVKTFTGYGVDSVSSLDVTSEVTLFKAGIVIASVSPASVFRGGMGEFQLAVKRFAEIIKRKGVL